MRCEDFEVLISAAADGELDRADQAKLDAHLACCEDCRREYEETCELQQQIAAALVHCDDSPDLVAGVTGMLRPRVRTRFGLRAWALAAAVITVAVCASIMLPLRRGPDVPPAPQVHAPRHAAPQPQVHTSRQPTAPSERIVAPESTRHERKPRSHRIPPTMNVVQDGSRSAPMLAEQAEITVEYVDDCTPQAAAQTAIDDPSQPPIPPQGRRPGERVVMVRETVVENGARTERLSHRIAKEEPTSESTGDTATQGE